MAGYRVGEGRGCGAGDGGWGDGEMIVLGIH